MQVVLESIGENVLRNLSTGVGAYRARLAPLWARFLKQEHAHHQLGHRWLSRVTGNRGNATLQQAATEYLALAEDIVCGGSEMCAALDVDTQRFWRPADAGVPDWIWRTSDGDGFRHYPGTQ